MPSTKTKAEEQKALDIAHIEKAVEMCRFKGSPFYVADNGYWQPLSEDKFRQLAYEILGRLPLPPFRVNSLTGVKVLTASPV